MMYMITIILSILVAINFFLLRFSCNKVTERQSFSKPFVVRKQEQSTITTTQTPAQLAPTGS